MTNILKAAAHGAAIGAVLMIPVAIISERVARPKRLKIQQEIASLEEASVRLRLLTDEFRQKPLFTAEQLTKMPMPNKHVVDPNT